MKAKTIGAAWALATATGVLGVVGGRDSVLAANVDGQWKVNGDGSWSTPTNWLNSVVADGSGNTADFNHVGIPYETTVHLDSPRTIGNLIFGDLSSSGGWVLDNNKNSANVLTLAMQSGSPTITVNALASGKSVQISAALDGNQGLTKAGSGLLILSGANTYTGVTTLSAGTVNLGVSELLGTGPLGSSPASMPSPIVLAGGYLQYSGVNNSDYSGRFSTAAGQQYNIDTNGQTVTWATPLTSPGGSLTKSGGIGALTLTAANTFSGPTTVWAGTLQLGDDLGHDGSVAGDIAINDTNAAVSYHLAGTQTYAGVISGVGTVTKTGSGALTLSGANGYTGTTSIDVGVLNIQNSTALGTAKGDYSAPDTTVNSGAALQIQGGITVGLEYLWIKGTGIRNDGAMRNISGSNTWQGTVKLSTGDTRINSDAGTLILTAATSIVGSDKLILGGAGDGTISGTISIGTGTVTKDGSGTWTLSGTSIYTGATTLVAGKVNLAAVETADTKGPLGRSRAANAGSIVLAGGYLQYSSVNQNDYSGRFSTAAGQQYNVDTYGQNVIWATKLTSSGGSLTKIGTGTLTLKGANTYTGLTTVTAGTLAYGAADAIGTGALTVNGAGAVVGLGANRTDSVGTVTVDGGGSITGTGTSTLTSTGTFEMKSGSASAILAGAGSALNKTTTGTVVLSGNNTYTGATNVNAGTLLVNGSLASGSAVTVATGATLGGSGTVSGSITVAGTIAPGNVTTGNISTLTTGAQTWSDGGVYEVDIAKAIAGATPSTVCGIDQDYLVISSLTLPGGFAVKPITSLGGPNGFAPSTANAIYEWVIARVSGASAPINLSGVNLITSSFAGGSHDRSRFSLFSQADAGGGQDVVLKYTYSAVPEATTLLLGIVGLAPVLLQRRRGAGGGQGRGRSAHA